MIGRTAMNTQRELTSEELKRIEIGILKDFNDVCEKNGLRYSIAFGTLLGAVRHGGFIPWDDDIDIIMPRPDFEKFSKIADNVLKTDHKLISIDTEKKFMAPLAKIINTNTSLYENEHASRVTLGVYTDIFVYDGMPEEKNKWNRIFKIAHLLQRGWGFCECSLYSKTPLPLRPIRRLCNKTMLARFFSKEMNRRAKKYPFENSKYMTDNMFLGQGLQERQENIFRTDEFRKLTEYQFEDISVKGFKNYDLFLSRWYGDYMTLPPEDEQVSNHDFNAYWNQRRI